MEAIINTLMNSPKLPLILENLQFKMSDEVKLRARFLNEITEQDKAEFINGEIIYHSPVRNRHLDVSVNLSGLLINYVKKNKSGKIGIEKMMVSLTRNDYEPDVCFYKKEKSRLFSKNQMRFPAPDFIIEILSPSTEKYDRGTKFQDYAEHNVAEYWIIDPDNEIVEQYLINNDKYELVQKSGTGTIKSKVIEGFEIPVRAIFDEEENLKALSEIIN